MPKPGGQLVDTVGPLGVIGGMDASVPTAGARPDTPEQLLNVDLDGAGRAITRPGSIFYSRLGEGPVLGLYEHSFEYGLEPRRPVAIVAD
ncbi:MAG: hypothetical protein R3190_14075, partial [Thermoanaerobaculia bacterium]|nr:hypothetical protein [Thermoanaerobaculia bacterium]